MSKKTKEKLRPKAIRGRSAARLAAVQTLFQCWASGKPADEVIPAFKVNFLPALLKDFDLEAMDEERYNLLVVSVLDESEAIDAILAPMLKEGWSLERLSEVDKASLRAGYIELNREAELPAPVIIQEYTAIAESCGGDYMLVNALLDRLGRDLRPDEMTTQST